MPMTPNYNYNNQTPPWFQQTRGVQTLPDEEQPSFMNGGGTLAGGWGMQPQVTPGAYGQGQTIAGMPNQAYQGGMTLAGGGQPSGIMPPRPMPQMDGVMQQGAAQFGAPRSPMEASKPWMAQPSPSGMGIPMPMTQPSNANSAWGLGPRQQQRSRLGDMRQKPQDMSTPTLGSTAMRQPRQPRG